MVSRKISSKYCIRNICRDKNSKSHTEEKVRSAQALEQASLVGASIGKEMRSISAMANTKENIKTE